MCCRDTKESNTWGQGADGNKIRGWGLGGGGLDRVKGLWSAVLKTIFAGVGARQILGGGVDQNSKRDI